MKIDYQQINNRKIATTFNEADSKKLVIICHGFTSSAVTDEHGWEKLTDELVKRKINVLRFDQYGSGKSEGDFIESSFCDWIKTIIMITDKYIKKGYEVVLLGKSMGGSAVIVSTGELPKLKALVLWVPDLKEGESGLSPNKIYFQNGNTYKGLFFTEAHSANIANALSKIAIPTLAIVAEEDEIVSKNSQRALLAMQSPNIQLEIMQNWQHSGWGDEGYEKIINLTCDWIETQFNT